MTADQGAERAGVVREGGSWVLLCSFLSWHLLPEGGVQEAGEV